MAGGWPPAQSTHAGCPPFPMLLRRPLCLRSIPLPQPNVSSPRLLSPAGHLPRQPRCLRSRAPATASRNSPLTGYCLPKLTVSRRSLRRLPPWNGPPRLNRSRSQTMSQRQPTSTILKMTKRTLSPMSVTKSSHLASRALSRPRPESTPVSRQSTVPREAVVSRAGMDVVAARNRAPSHDQPAVTAACCTSLRYRVRSCVSSMPR